MELNKSKFKASDCPRCGNSFTCFLYRNCPCEDVVIPDEAMDYIQLRYADCICPNCLKEMMKEFEKLNG